MPDGLTYRGEWRTGVDYAVGDMVRDGSNTYVVQRIDNSSPNSSRVLLTREIDPADIERRLLDYVVPQGRRLEADHREIINQLMEATNLPEEVVTSVVSPPGLSLPISASSMREALHSLRSRPVSAPTKTPRNDTVMPWEEV
jgi:hypothetical protein